MSSGSGNVTLRYAKMSLKDILILILIKIPISVLK